MSEQGVEEGDLAPWLQNPLAVALLEGRLSEGDHVLVDVSPSGEELTFERATEPATA